MGTRAPGEGEREFYERELSSFLPDRLFDMHAHLWSDRFHAAISPAGFPADVTHEAYIQLMGETFPGRRFGGWFLPKPILKDEQRDALAASEWVAEGVRGRADAFGAFLVRPDDDPEWVREQVRRLRLRGLKCYHVFSRSKPTFEADIPDYLPEALVQVAHEEHWIITLHLVKSRAVADPANIHWIRHYCTTYPGMKLILAHSARGFQPSHNFEGLPRLSDLRNVYFDTSANCEAPAHETILRFFDHSRVMFGTDFGGASHTRGRSLSASDTFLWIYEDTPVWAADYADIKPVYIVYEYLRALKWACWSARLTDSQVEDIFWNNAARLFA